MKKTIICILILFTAFIAKGQVLHCFTPDEEELMIQPYASSVCNDKYSYSIFEYPEMTPIKTVRISFNVIMRTDGSGSFLGTDSQIRGFFENIIEEANNLLADIPPQIPAASSNYIRDTRIRFKLNKVHFYRNDAAYNLAYGKNDDSTAIDIYDHFILTNNELDDIDKNHTLQVIMTPLLPGREAMGGQASGIGNRKWIFIRGYENLYNSGLTYMSVITGGIGIYSHHLIHEAGHSMGLHHTFYYYEDCHDHGVATNVKYTTTNYMDYPHAPEENYSKLCAFTECQIAKMHYYLMGMTPYSWDDISANVIRDFCDFDNDQSINIASGQNITWNNARNLRGNLTVEGNLTIKCAVSLPQDASIIVHRGGILNIEGGEFKNACGDPWGGITAISGGTLVLDGTSVSDYNIAVKGGGAVRIKNSLTVSDNHYIAVQSGGNICVESGANIRLADKFSLIKLYDGSIKGGTNCAGMPTNIPFSGNGSIVTFSDDVYIQNETISQDRYITGKNIYIGSNVTTSKATGDVKITNNARVVFDAVQNVYFDAGFECETGAGFEVVK